nr:Wzz/FepE/Etk N-terminal domain-containing protein [uncultured Roseateles sp.]
MNQTAQASISSVSHSDRVQDDGPSGIEMVQTIVAKWRLLAIAPLAIAAFALGATFLVKPSFTGKTVFIPPQQQSQSAAASALASLGALAGMAGMAGGVKTTADQYVALLQSENVSDRIIDKFELMKVYSAKFRSEARQELNRNVRITLGKKDGLIAVEADAESPQVAADMANQYVAELKRLTGELALTEAKQRRLFFEEELSKTRKSLTDAQLELQRSGFSAGALRAEPKAAADSYARLKAELVGAEVRLQTLRRTMANGSAELQQQSATVDALRSQVRQIESASDNKSRDEDYVGRYRDYKYQEALFEVFSRQYELARMDESKDSAIIQVVDVARPPEHKSKPKRAIVAVIAGAGSFVILVFGLLGRLMWRRAVEQDRLTRLTR